MAEESAEKEEAAKGDGAKAKPGLGQKIADLKKKINVALALVTLFALFNIAIVGGMAYWIYWMRVVYKKPALTEVRLEERYVQEQTDVSEQEQVTVPLGEFKVNLMGKEKKYSALLMVNMILEIYKKEYKVEITRDLPKLRDGVFYILANKNADQLRTLHGKLFLKDELLTQMNKIVKHGVIKNVFFTTFLIQ